MGACGCVGTHAEAAELVGQDYSSSSMSAQELEVRWMATGGLVCSVAAVPTTRVSDVKRLVEAQAGIPVEHQRLLLGAQELQGDVPALSPGTAALLLVRSVSDPRITNLGHFRPSADFEPLPEGEFRMVRKLASGIHGDVFSYRWQRPGFGEELVAVKKLRSERLQQEGSAETDERTLHLKPWRPEVIAEDALAEIGVLSYLARQPDLPNSLLRMRGIFAEDNFAWLVTEFAEGGELFDIAASERACTDSELQGYMFQLFQAVEYLHKHWIAHRDISLENILLKGGQVRLMDFGMSVRSHSASGVPLRFFRAVGKDYYRAPEAYVPSATTVKAVAPTASQPGDVAMVKVGSKVLCEVRFPPDTVPGRMSTAEVWGYAAQPADIFSCGVCLFMLAWQCPPWEKAVLADAAFAFVHERGTGGLEGLLRRWKRPLLAPELMHLLGQALQAEPTQRPPASSCLSSPWFEKLPEDTLGTKTKGDA